MTKTHHLCKLLEETIRLQDVFYDFMAIYFRTFKKGIMGEDTIPLMLMNKHEQDQLFEAIGFYYQARKHKVLTFRTNFFRIEEVHEKDDCITISFLIPLTVDGNFAEDICDVYRLERTKCCLTISIHHFCGLQFADPRLVNRKWPVIEPKW
jgi:hypothetical protein